ncbi:MAG: hypothetical protein BroJett040_12680 [Oligoflexia bacterium]|nr:MAG: hypothetical protein BroJett040_12680 [Oligoflexia bacterium]
MKYLISLALFASSVALASGGAPKAGGHGGVNLDLMAAPQPDRTKVLRPGKIEFESPAYMEKVSGTSATLKWKAAEKADLYNVQVAKDPAFKWIVAEAPLHKGTTYQVSGLAPGMHYFWRVAGIKSDNDPLYMQGWFTFSAFETVK